MRPQYKPLHSCQTACHKTSCQFHRIQIPLCQCQGHALPSGWTSPHDRGLHLSLWPHSSTCLPIEWICFKLYFQKFYNNYNYYKKNEVTFAKDSFVGSSTMPALLVSALTQQALLCVNSCKPILILMIALNSFFLFTVKRYHTHSFSSVKHIHFPVRAS